MNKNNLALLERDDLKYVSVCFIDSLGQIRSKLISKAKVLKAIESSNGGGFNVALPSLALGYGDTQIGIDGISSELDKFGDVPSKIDMESFREIPWIDKNQNVLGFLELEGEHSIYCTRSILKKSLANSKKNDIYPRFGIEFEFTLFDESILSLEEKNYSNIKTTTNNSSYNLLHRQNEQSDFYNSLCKSAEIMNIDVEAFHEEMGAGFMEVALNSGCDIKTADDAILIKHIIKQSALRLGKMASFMAKWSDKADGQSGHIHISLQNQLKENLFLKNENFFDSFIAGLQEYIPELMLLLAPNNNSYKRYQPDIFSPIKNDWGWDNRKVAFRAIEGNNKRIENRVPGADMNPYLGIASSILSGVAGIENNLKIKSDKEIELLPKTILEASNKIKNSKFANKVFDKDFIDYFNEFRVKENKTEIMLVSDIEKRRLIEFS